MAHNYYRIPLRIRLKCLKEMSASEGVVVSRSRCRRHRRKLTYLLNDFERRKAKRGAWMETHIWHAKRFHMAAQWGVKYPLRCADKSDRSTYRLAQHNSATVMDQSYYAFIMVQRDRVSGLIDFNKNLIFDAEGSFVCPCKALKLNDDLFVLQVHPSARD